MLSACSWWVHGVGPTAARAALRASSTNLDNLQHGRLFVLATSALWVPSVTPTSAVLLVVVLLAVVAPLERRIGTIRWLAAFAAGQVGATVLVAAGLFVGIRMGSLNPAVAGDIDVGWSYAVYSLAGVFAFTLPGRRRAPFLTLLLGGPLVAFGAAPNYVDVGHALATMIGIVLGPRLVSRRAQQEAKRGWSGI